MNDEVVVEVSGEATPPEEDALIRVAEKAIDETAQRIEQLTLAVAEISHFRGELEALKESFRAHVEGNQVDFIAVRDNLAALEQGVAVMREALEAEASLAEEALRKEIRAELEEEEEDEEEEIIEAASVTAALHEEPTAPVPATELPSGEPTKHERRRHFVRI